MGPLEHLEWLAENVAWFSSLDASLLDQAVPRCPGWDLEHLINHLSFGVGVAYPAAIATSPTDELSVTPLTSALPTGSEALEKFEENFSACLQMMRETDPTQPCFTYAGAGTAAFWFRRAAAETTLHRMDAADALGQSMVHLREAWSADAIREAVEFALPLAAAKVGTPEGELVIESPCLENPISVGHGAPAAVLTGEPHDVLDTLWGRSNTRVKITGDRALAAQWLGLIKTAFAGR